MFARPAEISDEHARHVHLCNNCLSTIAGHQTKSLPDDLHLNVDKAHTASGFMSIGQTPSFVRGLRDFADLGLEDTSVKQPEDDAVSVTSRNTASDASSEASFADVSSVESGHRGRLDNVMERATSVSKTFKKTRKTAAKKDEMSSDSEDDAEKPAKSPTQSYRQSIPNKETENSVRARGGTAVRFNVQEDAEVVNTESGVPKAQMERSLTKESLFTQGSSVSIPLEEEGELTRRKFPIRPSFRSLTFLKRFEYVSAKLPTYPSPKPTLTPTSYLGQMLV